MKIGELSARTGCNAHQLRYYESQGLLRSTRGANGYRDYDADAIREVNYIRESLAIGLSTREIAEINAALRSSPTREQLASVIEIVRARLRGVDNRLAALHRARQSLQDCADELEQARYDSSDREVATICRPPR